MSTGRTFSTTMRLPLALHQHAFEVVQSMQAKFICLTLNLLQLIEHKLGKAGVVNESEIKK